MVDRPEEIELVDFGRDERMKLIAERPASEEVATTALELTRARSAEHERQSPVFDEPMDLVQEGRDFLNFIDDDRNAASGGVASSSSRMSWGRADRRAY